MQSTTLIHMTSMFFIIFIIFYFFYFFSSARDVSDKTTINEIELTHNEKGQQNYFAKNK